MRIDILCEAESPSGTNSLNFGATLTINKNEENNVNSFSKDASDTFISRLKIDQVKEVVDEQRPIIVEFFNAMHGDSFESFLKYSTRLYEYLSSKAITSKSRKYSIFDQILNLGSKYEEELTSLSSFMSTIVSDDDFLIKKVGAIYEKFKRSTPKIFKDLFDQYTAYLNSLIEGKETRQSKQLRKNVLNSYWKNKASIEDLIEELHGLGTKFYKKEDSINDSTAQSELSKYFTEHKDELKRLSTKFLYIEYLIKYFADEGINNIYDLNSIKVFSGPVDKKADEVAIKNALNNTYESNYTLKKSGEGYNVVLASTSYPQIQEFINGLYENGNYSVSIRGTVANFHTTFESTSPYKLLHSVYKVTGQNHIYDTMNELYNLHGSVRKVVNEMTQVSQDEDSSNEHLKRFAKIFNAKYDKNSDSISFSESIDNPADIEKVGKFVEIMDKFKSEDGDYSDFISDSVKKLNGNENPNLNIKDAVRLLSKGGLTLHTYRLIQSEIKNPASEYSTYLINRVAFRVMHEVSKGSDLDKYLRSLLKTCLTIDAEDFLEAASFCTPHSINAVHNIVQFYDEIDDSIQSDLKSEIINNLEPVIQEYVDDFVYYSKSSDYVAIMKELTTLLPKYGSSEALSELTKLLNKDSSAE